MNKEEFKYELQKININITEEQFELLDKYYHLLIKWNSKMNLTAILEENDVYLKHFYDSLTVVKEINLLDVQSIIDVGSGAGFPGIVLKIFYPHLKLDIIDSNNKKILFLKEIVKNLNLENVTLIHGRCEQYAQTNKEKYDLVVSRAVANLNTLIELCLPLVKVNGIFLALKGDAIKELEEVDKELLILKGKIESKNEFLLPKELSKRTLVKIRKLDVTPKGYPRQYDKIKKKPLK